MKLSVFPSQLHGLVKAPASKSCMQRACAAALLRNGKTTIHNFGISNDDHVAITIIKDLGATIEYVNDTLIITSNGISPLVKEINCGESGLSMRMFASIAALSNLPLTITGNGSLLKRPMDFFNEVFPKLTIDIKSNDGKLPLNIKGPLIAKNIVIDGSLSSQFLTGLLFAYSASDAKDLTITVTNLKSKPYVDLTLNVLSNFGMKVPKNNNYETFYFDSTSTPPSQNSDFTVEGDWSNGALLLVAGAISGSLKISGLDISSTQADKEILKVLRASGCEIQINNNEIQIESKSLNSFTFDATECPDLFPPLVALAAYCKGVSKIKGISRLTYKESNRALTLKEEFHKLGVTIDLIDDDMLVYGGEKILGAIVQSHHDHRIAMALAITALRAESEIQIIDADAVDKSYPNFYIDLKQIGLNYSIK